jgi:hypothetical protein
VCDFEPAAADDADVLRLVPPVEAYPGSGMSVPEFNAAAGTLDVPLLLSRRIGEGGLTYFPWEPDRIGFHFGLRDPMRLLVNALRAPGELVRLQGPGLVDVSVMDGPRSRALHVVNFNGAAGMRSGHRRALEEVVPLHGLAAELRLPEGVECTGVELAVSGDRLPFTVREGRVQFTFPVVGEFESAVVTWQEAGR